MPENELVSVIGSTALADVVERSTPVLDICPRANLGLFCLRSDQYQCLCEVTEAYETSIQRGGNGEPVSVTLVMKVPARGMDSAQAVIAGVQMTGLIADNVATSRHEVRATFSLSRNHNLRAHVFNNWL